MPISLPQLSRREFLKRAALAGAAAALTPEIYAELAAKPRRADTFFFLSDTHIAADTALKHIDVNMAANLAATVREVIAWPVAPAAIIVCGDLAFKSGQAGDYVAFGKLIETIRAVAPVHLLLGNHDQREHFWNAFPQDATRLDSLPQRQAAVLASEPANWFLLDSLNVTDATAGKLGAPQLDWLARELAVRPEKPAIVVCHHHLNEHGGIGGLEDSPALTALLEQHWQVKAYVYGHTHHWHITQHKSGQYLVNLPPTAYVFQRTHPSGWVRCTLAGDRAEFELRSLDPQHPEHGKIQRLEWRAT